MNLRDAALYYLRRGYGVLPVGPDKRPLLPWKELQDRYLSEGDVDQWWGGDQPAQLALLTGPISGGLAVLDIDDVALADRLAQDVGLRAETTLIRTPRGGLHIYVTESQARSKSGPLIAGVADLKAEGGYVLAPPSRTLVGAYRVVAANPPKGVDEARSWALALLKAYDVEAKAEREPLYKEALRVGARIVKGNRNATLTSIAGKLRHSLNFEEGLSILLGRNQTLQPPLPEAEVHKIAESVWAYGHEEGVSIVTLNTVDPEAVSWLWYPRFPMGKLTILAGPAGVGKSTLLLDLAARVTRGAPLPDGGGPAPDGDVILLTAEDGLADTVRPRVDRQGGDPRRIHVLTGVRGPDGEEQWFSLAEHLPLLQDAIHRYPTRMVIVDPIIAYCGRVDTHKASEVRGMLAPVAGMAEQELVCVVGVMHLNKRSAEAFALHRITGAQDFTAAPRVVSMVGEDPEDKDGRRRVFLCLKNNLAPKGNSLGFHFAEDGGLHWDGQVATDAAKLLAAPASVEDRSAIEEATDFLAETLAPGAQDTQRIFREAKGEGIAITTLRRAATLMGVVKFKAGTGGPTGHGYWSWRLPGQDAHVEPLTTGE